MPPLEKLLLYIKILNTILDCVFPNSELATKYSESDYLYLEYFH